MKELKKFWFGLAPQQQLFVIVFVVVFAWICWTYIKSKKDMIQNTIKHKAEIDVLHDQGVKENYPLSTYDQWANQLFKAMDGYGTDEDVILEIFRKLKNDADYIKLDAAFGVRTATDDLFGVLEPQDMKGWLKDDLSETLIKSINSALKNQGLTKQI